jgi:hypothetical protein
MSQGLRVNTLEGRKEESAIPFSVNRIDATPALRRVLPYRGRTVFEDHSAEYEAVTFHPAVGSSRLEAAMWFACTFRSNE